MFFTKISCEMSEAGYTKTMQQCREIKKLKAEYGRLKGKKGKTREDRKDWDYYDAMDDILGSKPATHPPVVVDTLVKESEEHEDQRSEQHDPSSPTTSELVTTGDAQQSATPTS